MVAIEHSDAGSGHVCEQPASFVDLVRRLDELAAEFEPVCRIPYAVDLVRETEGRLAVGMSNDGWMISYFPPDDAAPLNSLGDRDASGSISFFFGDHTPVSRKYLIPRTDALRVLREWWDSGTVTSSIEWTEDNFLGD